MIRPVAISPRRDARLWIAAEMNTARAFAAEMRESVF